MLICPAVTRLTIRSMAENAAPAYISRTALRTVLGIGSGSGASSGWVLGRVDFGRTALAGIAVALAGTAVPLAGTAVPLAGTAVPLRLARTGRRRALRRLLRLGHAGSSG